MDSYDFDVRLTPAARELLRPDEALVLDWHRMAICCAGVGEANLYAARAIFPHLAGREIKLDARKTFGVRRFCSDLPRDFGLRAVIG
jgi:hypothetical protein